MILIADSGSTKTDWRLIDENQQIHQFATQGINPYFQGADQIKSILCSELVSKMSIPALKGKPDVFFYGAGCRVEDKKKLVAESIAALFPESAIQVNTDMLGAARSLCGRTPGLAAILGTGANTCYYDGTKIAENKTSSGFILGDEGSGAHIGKTFIEAFLRDELPKELSERFTTKFDLNKDKIIDAVYRQPMPNRFLASFSKFIYQNLKEQYLIDITAACFGQFFDRYICKYKNHKELQLSCTGSVAFYYSNILRAVAVDKGVAIGTITETPIAGLTLYHLEE